MMERTETTRSPHPEDRGSCADLLAGFAEAIPVPVVLLTPDRRVRYANAAFVRTLGVSAEPYLHRKLPNRWLMEPRESLPRLREILHKLAEGQAEPEPICLSLRGADGAEIPTEIHARFVPDVHDGLGSLIVMTFSRLDRDTTELKRIREEFKHSQERLKIIFECAPDAYYLSDLKGTFIDGNRAAEKMVGYRREELIGKSFLKLNLLPKSQIPRAASALIKNAVGRPTGPEEFTLIRKDGTERTMEVSTYPVKIQGRVLVLGIARDITERKRAEEELRQSEEQLKVMTDSAHDAIVMTDSQGRITFYNRTAQTMFGWTPAEAVGQDLHNLLTPPEYREACHQGFAHFGHTGQGPAVGKTLELTALRKDGTEFPIEISVAAVALNDEWHAIGIVRDITERKRAQEQILHEKVFSDSVINSMPGVFYMLGQDGRFVRWNHSFEEVAEYTSTEMANIHPLELFRGADREKIADGIAKTFAEGRAAVEADLVSKSGWKTPYYFTGARVEKDGTPYLVGLGIDITERQKARGVLEKLNADLEATVRELERSNKELHDFAHITAHDLKAPLRGIATLADWLAQDYADQIDEQGRENLHLLQQRVDRMTHLINGILRYSEIGHGDQDIEMLDTGALVQEVIEQIAAPEHIEIHVEGELPSVPGERTRLTQVFQNLISNAVKYIDKPQGCIRISAHSHEDTWEFCVVDNGPGIEAKHFARIFQMFQTLTSTDHSDSTGLGLAVVKKIVDTYGGRIWLESEIGVGSTFHFTLPKEARVAAVGQSTDTIAP